ncbi:MAG: hypothetical protein Q8M71_06410 [Thermodesulfovibrionales bacterium]|nr:hypothetical protein [Thermodesulfovibrionales bacterium]
MPSTSTYKISEKKCATCSYWTGGREIQVVNLKPYYIKAVSGQFQCLLNPARKVGAVSQCNRWKMWEKID